MAAAKIKSTALSVTHKCRVLLTSNINARSSLITCCCSCSDLPRPFLSQNILAAGWEAHLNTIKADAKGSKEEIYTSRVHYVIQKSTPYLIVPENDMHNINIVIDERGSLAVCSPIRGRVASLLKSLKKMPPRVAMTGDVLRLRDSKVPIIADSLKKAIMKEHEASSAASHGVSAILSSAGPTCRSRSEGLLSLLNEESSYSILKFDIGSCVYIDSSGSNHNIELDSFELPKPDLLMPFSAKLIDGINRSDSRRRALILFCFESFNVWARNAVMLSIDHHGFDVLAKVPERIILANVSQQYHWKEFRFTFKEPAMDVEGFCRRLVELEDEVLQSVKRYSGLG